MRLAFIILLAAALLLLLAAAASAQPEFFEAGPAVDPILPAAGWRMVGQFRVTPAGGINAAAYRYALFSIQDEGTASWTNVTDVALAEDLNDDGVWDPATEPMLNRTSSPKMGEPTRRTQIRYNPAYGWGYNVTHGPRFFMFYRLAGLETQGYYQPMIKGQGGGRWDKCEILYSQNGSSWNWNWKVFVANELLEPVSFRSVAGTPGTTDDTPTPVAPGSTNAILADVVFEASGPEDLMIETLVITRTAGDPAYPYNIRLVLDVNTDGAYDLSSDVVLDSADTLDGFSEYTFELNRISGVPVADLLEPGATGLRLLVVADFPSPLPEGMRFAVSVVDGSTGSELGLSGLPAEGAGVVARTPLEPNVTVSIEETADRPVPAGEDHVLVTLTLDAAQLTGTLQSVLVRPIGTVASRDHVRGFGLAVDSNRNGILDRLGEPGGDTRLGYQTQIAIGASLLLDAGGLTLSHGTRTRLMVIASFDESIPDGRMLAVEVVDLMITGNTDTPELVGLPVQSPALIADASASGEQDPEFDPLPVGPFNVASPAGCAAGTGASPATLAWLVLVAIAGLVVRHRHA